MGVQFARVLRRTSARLGMGRGDWLAWLVWCLFVFAWAWACTAYTDWLSGLN